MLYQMSESLGSLMLMRFHIIIICISHQRSKDMKDKRKKKLIHYNGKVIISEGALKYRRNGIGYRTGLKGKSNNYRLRSDPVH